MTRNLWLGAGTVLLLILTGCAAMPWTQKNRGYDVVVEVSPLSARELRPGARVDALEENGPKTLVAFQIHRVVIGQLAMEKRGGPSRMEQAAQAFKDKEFATLATLNFQDPNVEFPKELLTVAVRDSGTSFGFLPGEEPPAGRQRVYLKRISANPERFNFIKAHPES